MKTILSAKTTLGKMLYRVTALVLSKVTGEEIRAELDRLEHLPTSRASFEIAGVLAVLFGVAVFAASFGVLGLLCFFVIVLLIFR